MPGRSLKPSRTLWGSWAWKPFCLPFLVGKTPASMTYSRVPKGRLKQLLIKGETAKKPSEARLKELEKLIKIRRPNSSVSQETEIRDCRSCRTLILIGNPILVIKSSLNPPGLEHNFVRHEPPVSPFAWQSNKAILFYFTKTVSEIQLGTSAELLAISVNLFGLPMSHFISSKWGTFTSLFPPFENGDYTSTYLNTVLKIKWCIKVLGTDTFLKCGSYHINIY